MNEAEKTLALKVVRNIAIFIGVKWVILIGMNRAFRKAAARAAAKS